MDLNILSDLRQYLAAATVAISTLLLLFVAPGLAIAWLKKTLWLSIILGLWMLFVYPYQNGLESLAIYTLCVFVYPMLTEKSAIFIYQAILFLITFKLFVWIFDVHGPHKRNHQPEQNGRQ